MKTVYVVIGNDFPDAVFSTERLAEIYCEQKRAEKDANNRPSKIYWKVYPFIIDGKI